MEGLAIPVPEAPSPIPEKIGKVTLSIPVLLLGVYVAILFNWSRLGPDGATAFVFTSPLANRITWFTALLSPFFALAFVAIRWRGMARIVAYTLSIIMALPTIALIPLFFIFAGFSEVMQGVDPGFERLRQIKLAGCNIVTYRTNGGATTSFGIQIRQETTILPGLFLVKTIYHFYPATAAEIEVIGPRNIRVKVNTDKGTELTNLQLSP